MWHCWMNLPTYGQLQDFVKHDIWRDVEVEHKILEKGEEVYDDDDSIKPLFKYIASFMIHSLL